jgi:collagen type VI alpha/Meckel syndrome type 1 protein
MAYAVGNNGGQQNSGDAQLSQHLENLKTIGYVFDAEDGKAPFANSDDIIRRVKNGEHVGGQLPTSNYHYDIGDINMLKEFVYSQADHPELLPDSSRQQLDILQRMKDGEADGQKWKFYSGERKNTSVSAKAAPLWLLREGSLWAAPGKNAPKEPVRNLENWARSKGLTVNNQPAPAAQSTTPAVIPALQPRPDMPIPAAQPAGAAAGATTVDPAVLLTPSSPAPAQASSAPSLTVPAAAADGLPAPPVLAQQPPPAAAQTSVNTPAPSVPAPAAQPAAAQPAAAQPAAAQPAAAQPAAAQPAAAQPAAAQPAAAQPAAAQPAAAQPAAAQPAAAQPAAAQPAAAQPAAAQPAAAQPAAAQPAAAGTTDQAGNAAPANGSGQAQPAAGAQAEPPAEHNTLTEIFADTLIPPSDKPVQTEKPTERAIPGKPVSHERVFVMPNNGGHVTEMPNLTTGKMDKEKQLEVIRMLTQKGAAVISLMVTAPSPSQLDSVRSEQPIVDKFAQQTKTMRGGVDDYAMTAATRQRDDQGVYRNQILLTVSSESRHDGAPDYHKPTDGDYAGMAAALAVGGLSTLYVSAFCQDQKRVDSLMKYITTKARESREAEPEPEPKKVAASRGRSTAPAGRAAASHGVQRTRRTRQED